MQQMLHFRHRRLPNTVDVQLDKRMINLNAVKFEITKIGKIAMNVALKEVHT